MHPDDLLTDHFRLIKTQKAALKKLKIETVRDLLYHFPARYGQVAAAKNIAELKKGDEAIIRGRISKLEKTKAWRKKIPLTRANVEDASGKIRVVWFHQPYLAEMMKEGALVELKGKVTEDKTGLYIANPTSETRQDVTISSGLSGFYPSHPGYDTPLQAVYPESRGVTSRWFYYALKKALANGAHKKIDEYIPSDILKKYHLPSLSTALVWIHQPKTIQNAEAARKRFSFEEVFFIQLARQKARREYKAYDTFPVAADEKQTRDFTKRFPFELTNSQNDAIHAILDDFRKEKPMTRLLEGDVGSGKTAVAATTAYAIVTTRPKNQNFGNLQAAVMAPTEILAKQHFESFIELFSHLPIQIGLITGSGCLKFPSKVNPKEATNISRAQLLKWVANGEIPILIGTHALIQKEVRFKHLAYVIIDEQHRFGVYQRGALVRRPTQTDTQTNADTAAKDDFLYKDITYKIRGACFAVKKNLGLGHKEYIYQKALEEELRKQNIRSEREKQIPIYYNKKKIGVYQPDFIIENKILIELKALPYIGKREENQFWSYVQGSDYELALLINFDGNDVTFKRVINSKNRKKSPRESASGPRESALMRVPHLLSMTATPIPRTLALTIYGDLDLTLMTEMPKGRKPIITEIVLPNQRKDAYEKVRKELALGRQAYVICPRIDEPDPEKERALLVKSVKEEAKRLKKEVFPEYEIEILHSKVKPKERDELMQKFLDKKIDILVATSVIEVGVNVPNATVIMIEGAERFGLAQLHQLRGRVLRSTHQAYCYVFPTTRGRDSLKRLKALKDAKNGFELAELDLKLRGAGSLSGTKQWGMTDIGMEAIQNLKMVEAARTEAEALLAKDSELKKYPALTERAETEETHWE